MLPEAPAPVAVVEVVWGCKEVCDKPAESVVGVIVADSLDSLAAGEEGLASDEVVGDRTRSVFLDDSEAVEVEEEASVVNFEDWEEAAQELVTSA